MVNLYCKLRTCEGDFIKFKSFVGIDIIDVDLQFTCYKLQNVPNGILV